MLMGELSGFSLTKLALSGFRPIGREEEEFCSPAATPVGMGVQELRIGFGRSGRRLAAVAVRWEADER